MAAPAQGKERNPQRHGRERAQELPDSGSGKRPDHLPFRHEPLVVWYLGKNLHNRISLLQP